MLGLASSPPWRVTPQLPRWRSQPWRPSAGPANRGNRSWSAGLDGPDGGSNFQPARRFGEVITVVRRLLDGENVTFSGRHVQLDSVQLNVPPAIVPPVVAGVRGPKSLALAGRVANGVVLAEGTGPLALQQALKDAKAPGPFSASVFSPLCVTPSAKLAYQIVSTVFGPMIEADDNPALQMLPFYGELQSRLKSKGFEGLASMPRDWWLQLGPIGTFDDALEHVDMMKTAGATRSALFPAPVVDVARIDLQNHRDDQTSLVVGALSVGAIFLEFLPRKYRKSECEGQASPSTRTRGLDRVVSPRVHAVSFLGSALSNARSAKAKPAAKPAGPTNATSPTEQSNACGKTKNDSRPPSKKSRLPKERLIALAYLDRGGYQSPLPARYPRI